jgi:hypothetical protein
MGEVSRAAVGRTFVCLDSRRARLIPIHPRSYPSFFAGHKRATVENKTALLSVLTHELHRPVEVFEPAGSRRRLRFEPLNSTLVNSSRKEVYA